MYQAGLVCDDGVNAVFIQPTATIWIPLYESWNQNSMEAHRHTITEEISDSASAKKMIIATFWDSKALFIVFPRAAEEDLINNGSETDAGRVSTTIFMY